MSDPHALWSPSLVRPIEIGIIGIMISYLFHLQLFGRHKFSDTHGSKDALTIVAKRVMCFYLMMVRQQLKGKNNIC